MSNDADIIVIGAGMAGASVAAHLAATHRVSVLEMEDRPAYHTTGRSAARFERDYGPPVIRALTAASKPLFDNPPDSFADGPILTPRPTLFVAPHGQEHAQAKFETEATGIEPIALADAAALVPILEVDVIRAAHIDRMSADIDVDRLHQGYLRTIRRRGATLVTAAEVTRIHRSNGSWRCSTKAGEFAAPLLVDAAGAWGDLIARLAGATPLGLVPRRRSAALVPAPDGMDVNGWPFVCDVADTFYFKPTGSALMVSPADVMEVEPHDAFADDMAIAEGIERVQSCTTLKVARLLHTWGGLRTFCPDGNPAVGFDASVPGFFWLVGQGGYGIQTAPALSLLAASLIRGEAPPEALSNCEIDLTALSPARLRR